MRKIYIGMNFHFLALVIAVGILSLTIHSQTTAFTHQGKLTDGGVLANGTYEMQFALFDAAAGGTQIGSTITNDLVTVTNGIFTVQLDFSAPNAFDGNARWLEISVKKSIDPSFTTLTPRQPLTSAPYAIKALHADTAADSAQLGGFNASEYVKTDNPALTDDRNPLPGSSNYIQNGTSVQPISNFSISGEGKANILSASTHFSIGTNRVLKADANGNTFGGFGSGQNNTGSNNSFFGSSAGQANIAGTENAGFGSEAGMGGTANRNSFFGFRAGKANNAGTNNAFVGHEAGLKNLDGDANTFIGKSAGTNNTSGDQHTFVGALTGGLNAGGSQITLLGALASVPGGTNLVNATAIGANAIVSQSNSVVLGSNANVGIGTSTPASKLTVVGLIESTTGGVKFPDGTTQTTAFAPANAILNQTALQTGNFNISGTGIADVFRAATQFDIGANRVLSTAGTHNIFIGTNTGLSNTGPNNTFVGAQAGAANTIGEENTIVGSFAGANNVNGIRNVFVGRSAGVATSGGSQNVSVGADSNAGGASGINATSVGFNAGRFSSGGDNSFFGSNAGRGSIGEGNVYVGSFTGDDIAGNFNTAIGATAGGAAVTATRATLLGFGANLGADNLSFATAIGSGAIVSTSNTILLGRTSGTDLVRIHGLGAAGLTNLCRNANNEISTCSSSLRYKANIQPFGGGFDLVARLKPITFDWKQSGDHDLGLGAEDVAAVSELLVTRNKTGEIEGVKYDRIGVVLINVVKEQQSQIDELKKQIAAMKKLIEGKFGDGEPR